MWRLLLANTSSLQWHVCVRGNGINNINASLTPPPPKSSSSIKKKHFTNLHRWSEHNTASDKDQWKITTNLQRWTSQDAPGSFSVENILRAGGCGLYLGELTHLRASSPSPGQLPYFHLCSQGSSTGRRNVLRVHTPGSVCVCARVCTRAYVFSNQLASKVTEDVSHFQKRPFCDPLNSPT